ncbi:hypothetical protein CHCC20335_1573 [Bacillus paralicheniformis]|nr:hypothetical protein CHCC20335_1573 [Bacillus paralicheniformis]
MAQNTSERVLIFACFPSKRRKVTPYDPNVRLMNEKGRVKKQKWEA